MVTQLNPRHADIQPLYDAIPSYWEACQIEKNHQLDYSQIPYFVMAIALLVVFALTLTGKVPSYVLIVAWFIALSRCF